MANVKDVNSQRYELAKKVIEVLDIVGVIPTAYGYCFTPYKCSVLIVFDGTNNRVTRTVSGKDNNKVTTDMELPGKDKMFNILRASLPHYSQILLNVTDDNTMRFEFIPIDQTTHYKVSGIIHPKDKTFELANSNEQIKY